MSDEKVISVRLRAITDQFKASMDRAAGSVKSFASDTDRITQAGARMKTAGRAMTVGLSLPLAAVGTLAVKTALDFDTSMSRIQGLVGLSADEVASMRDRVLDLAGATTKAPQELADALFFITSAGFEGAAALDVLELSAKASAAGLGETKTVADAVTSIMLAYGPGVISAAEATDQLVATVRAAKVEAADLAPQLGRVLPKAAALGIEFDELGGTLAFLTKASGDASQATTDYDAILRKLVAPSAQMETTLDGMGLSMEQLRQEVDDKGLIPTLRMLEERFGGNTIAAANFFEEGSAVSGVMQILNDETGQLDSALQGTANSTGTLASAFDAWNLTDAAKGARAWAELQTSLIELGGQLAPILGNVADAVATLAQWFTALPDGMQTAVVLFGVLLTVAGPLVSLGGSLLVAWGSVGPTIMAAATAVRTMTIAAASTNPVLAALIVGAAAVGLALQFMTADADTTSDTIDGLTTAAAGGADGIDAFLAQLLQGETSGATFAEGVDKAGGSLDDLQDALAGGPDALAAWLNGMADVAEANGAVLESGRPVADFLRDIADNDASGPLGELTGKLFEMAEGWDSATETGSRAGDQLADLEGDATTLIPGMDGVADATAGVNDELNAGVDLAAAYGDALSQLFGLHLAAEEAAIAYRDELAGLRDTIAEGGFDPNTDAGRQGLIDLAQSAFAAAEALLEETGSVEGANFVLAQHANDLVAVLQQTGMTESAAASYAATLLGIPEDEATRITNTAQLAELLVASMNAEIDRVPPGVSVPVSTNADAVAASFARLRDRINEAAAAANTSPAALGYTGLVRPSAAGGIYRARPGGHILQVAEGGFDEVLVSTDPKHAKRNAAMLGSSGILDQVLAARHRVGPAPARLPAGVGGHLTPAARPAPGPATSVNLTFSFPHYIGDRAELEAAMRTVATSPDTVNKITTAMNRAVREQM